MSGQIGDFPLDEIKNLKVENRADPTKPGQVFEGPELVAGRIGKALKLSGENNVTLPMGNFDRFEPFSIGLWIKTPGLEGPGGDPPSLAGLDRRRQPGLRDPDRGRQAERRPGPLLARQRDRHQDQGSQSRSTGGFTSTMTYDGSSRASGLTLYLDGRRADCEVVRDTLTKNITGGGGDELTVGQRFRDRGFKNGLVDEINGLRPGADAARGGPAWRRHDAEQGPAARPRHVHSRAAAGPCSPITSPTSTPSTELAWRLSKSCDRQRSALVDPVAEIMVMKELPQPRPTFVLRRGAYDAPTEPVARDTPAALLPFAPDWPRNRLGLARWVTDPKQPLTARVTVNRWWQSIFGRGIVATPEDFGSQGQLPSHPELLDWLARSFIDSGWDVKDLWRLIVTSATYRQASEASPELHGPRSRKRLARSRSAVPAARRDDPRQRTGGQRPAGRQARRAAGQALSAGRAVGREGQHRLHARRG